MHVGNRCHCYLPGLYGLAGPRVFSLMLGCKTATKGHPCYSLTLVVGQELSSILQYIYSSREDDDGMLRDGQHSGKHCGAWADGLQTFVFSATLMLPNALRKRLRKGASLANILGF